MVQGTVVVSSIVTVVIDGQVKLLLSDVAR